MTESRPDPRAEPLAAALAKANGQRLTWAFIDDAAALLAAIDASPAIALVAESGDPACHDLMCSYKAEIDARSSHSDVSADPLPRVVHVDEYGRPSIETVHSDVSADLRAALERVTVIGPETPGRRGLDPRSFTVHLLPSHWTEDAASCPVCAALAATDPTPKETL